MDKHTILVSLYFSQMARLDKDALTKRLPGAKFIENKETDTQCFMYRSSKLLIISFRGTQQPRDWLTDVDAWQVTYPYGNNDSNILVHQGFIKAYKSVRGDILAEIARTDKDWESILVCGHSLGGALATLCAVDVQYNVTSRIECYPSGNPAVGNKAFVKSYNKRVPNTIRTFMRTDIVPMLPPKWFFKKLKGGYAHTAKANAIGSWNPFIGIKFWILGHLGKLDAADLTNHSIDLYEKHI